MPDTVTHIMADPSESTVEAMQREVATIHRDLASRQETRQREHATLQELLETLLHGQGQISTEKFKSI